MPNIKSAKKRMRTSEEDRVRNKAIKTRIKNVRLKVLETPADGPDTSADTYRTYCSVLDKAVKKGTLHRNTAIRRKRRAAARIRTEPAADSPTGS